MHAKQHSSLSSLSLGLVLVLVVVGALALPSTARADRSWYVGFGAGPYNDFYCCRLHGRIQGEIGWHFSGDDTGFFLEADAIATVGPDYWMFTGGLRLGGDIQVHHDPHFHVLLRPNGLVGLGARDYDGDGKYGPIGHFLLQPAFDVRLVLADGLIAIWVRPVAFDFLFWFDHNSPVHGADFTWSYQAMGGIDFQF